MPCSTRRVIERVLPSCVEIMVSFFPEVGLDGSGELAAEFGIQDLGHAEAGWKPLPEVLNKTCANSEEEF